MRTVRVLIAALAMFTGVALFTGCGMQGGKTIMTQGGTSEPVMGTAPQAGQYALYTSMSANPTATVSLKEGDPLGFRKAEDGHLVGVAGGQSFDLPHGTAQAYWKLQSK
ncbi:MAG TPA: hypothetical protein VGI81_22290 [Tepidisphaeraceae bacterium]|jgi:hypothetical protein